jgi:hypothetical protein
MRFGSLGASVFVGLLWSTWHVWYATYLRLTSTAVIYAWMYNSTNGSLFIAMIAHLGHNLAASLIPTSADGGGQHLVIAFLYSVAATSVILATDVRTLRRRSP